MKVNITQRLRADPDLLDLLKRMAYQINTLSEGSISAKYSALTAAPTAGKWAQGDFLHNIAPSVNAFTGQVVHGWLCTVSGTPGTWVDCSYQANAPTATGWIAPTLLNGWVNYGGGYNNAGYMKDAHGFVHLKGLIMSGTTTPDTALFNLPAEFRPASQHIFAVTSDHAFGQARVQSGGDVTLRVGSPTWFSLDGISFKAT